MVACIPRWHWYIAIAKVLLLANAYQAAVSHSPQPESYTIKSCTARYSLHFIYSPLLLFNRKYAT